MKVIASIIFFCVLAEGTKILFVTMPDGKSHWGSMSPLAKRLVKDGHEVSVYMEVMKPTSLSPEFIGYLVELKNSNIKDPHEDENLLDMMWNSDFGPIGALFPWSHSYTCYKHVIENQPHGLWRVTNKTWDLIMVDSLFTISGMAMAQKLSVPYAIFSTSLVQSDMAYYMNLRWSTVTQPPLFLKNDKPTWTEKSFWDRLYAVKHDLIWLGVVMGPVQWMLYKSGSSGWRSYVAHSTGAFSEGVESLDWAMSKSNELFYIGTYCPLPETIKPLPEALENFVSDPKSTGTVVVAFGTIANWALAPREKLMAMIDALKQLTDYRVIWAYKGTDLHLPNHIKTMAWLPQNDLLNHKRTKLFVSHGGLKSLKETVCAEVPAVYMPIFAEQVRNSFAASEAGFGEYLNKKNLTANYIAGQIRKVLSNKMYYEKVKRSKELMLDRMMDSMDYGSFWVKQIIKRKGLPSKYFKPNQKKWLIESLNLDIIVIPFVLFVISLK